MTKFEEKVLDMVPSCPEPPEWYVYEQLKNRGYSTKMSVPEEERVRVLFEIDLEFRIEFAKKLLIKIQGKE